VFAESRVVSTPSAEWLLQQEMDGYSFLRATPLHLRALERGN
jgi:hypothetical protein